MFQVLSLLVSNPDGSSPTTVTIDHAAGTVSLGGPVVPFAALENQAAAILELVDQSTTDGTLTLQISAQGGPTVIYVPGATPAEALIRPHHSIAAGWSTSKVTAYLDALSAIGLLP